MALHRNFLDRLREPPPRDGRDRRDTLEETMDAIRDHLERLLNSRHGQAQTLADYGIPSVSETGAAYAESVNILRNAIRRTVEQYEPRLRGVRVSVETVEGMKFDLRFHISAEIVPAEDHARVFFETTFDTAGVAHISR